MTNKLTLHTCCSRRLGAEQYFKCLISHMDESGRDDVRAQVIRVAEGLAKRLTFGASSSIKAEAAQGLIESVMYCTGYSLKQMEGDVAVCLLKTPVEGLWKEGRAMIRERLERERRVLGELSDGRFTTENRAYNDTVAEGLPGFFNWYDTDFAAHDNPGFIDYPLCCEVDGLSGIEYISEYLKRLSIECRFCASLEGGSEALLRCLGRDYRDAYVNIYELSLTNAAGRVLCGADISSLDISGSDRERLKASLGAMSGKRLHAVMLAAAERACVLAGTESAQDRAYARSAMKGIISRVRSALDNKSLEAVFLEYKAEKQPARFFDNKCMDDDEFREVTQELRECRHADDKLAIIKAHIKSVTDLADMLGASCLFGSEFEAVFETLDDDTLALLYQMLSEDSLHLSQAESEWHGKLASYLESRGKTKSIKALCESAM